MALSRRKGTLLKCLVLVLALVLFCILRRFALLNIKPKVTTRNIFVTNIVEVILLLNKYYQISTAVTRTNINPAF